MALSQSALSELLEAFRTGEGVNLIQDAVKLALQELVEIEATSVIGAGRDERTGERKTERNRRPPGPVTTTAGDVHCGSRSCARAPSSRASSSRAAGSTRRCT